ncbi:lactonase family protein [Fodinicola acaciae]|uniref:lactonase family protein n=1 Tax=Fodinicola acaciae TaxID=2681555 RepID=UPI0013D06050|nr:lactonase family protein [Fodinicola acaciae]
MTDFLYVGSYAGAITTVTPGLGVVATTESPGSPSFLAIHPAGHALYAIDESDDGSVTAFRANADGTLTKLNTEPAEGSTTAHLTVDPSGKHLLTVNYGSGSVIVHPINDDGSLGKRTDLVRHQGEGPDKSRQEGPHAHVVRFAPSGGYALVADLGTDEVVAYALDGGRLVRQAVNNLQPGVGPRHLVFGRDNRVYLVGELDSTIRTYRDDNGQLTELDARPASKEQNGVRNYPSEIALSDDGQFCYVANRGYDVISAFDVSTGIPRPLADVSIGGAWPRHLATAADQLWVANQNSDNLRRFQLDRFGIPRQTGESLQLTAPACIVRK